MIKRKNKGSGFEDVITELPSLDGVASRNV